MKKITATKLVSLVLLAFLLLPLFAACSNAEDKNMIIIGGIGPLTGEASTYGVSVKQGAEIAIKEINDAGGVNGIKLKLYFEDDQADGSKAISAYETLMDKGMQILMGAVTSGSSVALNDYVKKDKILQVTPSASQIEAAENPTTFRICFIDPFQGQEMAKYIYNTLGYTKAAIIFNQDDSYSTGMKDAFKDQWAELEGTISAEVSFGKSTTDFGAQMTQIANSDAEFLFMPIYAEKAAQIVLEADKKEVDLPLFGGDGLDGILTYLKGENAKLVEGMTYLTPFIASDEDEAVQSFVSKYEAAYKEKPDQFAADGYDAIYVIAAALKEANVTQPKELDVDALVAAMKKIEVDGLTGKMTFDDDGEPNKPAKFAKIVDGKYVAQ
ncbi:MAG: ABC transporter substrate-binding protein [Clostridiales bacterium]|nr:ABC transporter substrate-binding protein [Clostridiales bacterium]